jgi:hypothetical protein
LGFSLSDLEMAVKALAWPQYARRKKESDFNDHKASERGEDRLTNSNQGVLAEVPVVETKLAKDQKGRFP